MLRRMAPSPIPSPLPPWARVLVQLAPFIPTALQNVLEYVGEAFPADHENPTTWLHAQLIGQPKSSTERADDFVTTIDLLNVTNGFPDSSWTQADFDTVHAHLDNLCTSWCSRMSDDYRWREMRFYLRTFNPYSITEPFAKTGPPAIIYPMTVAGTKLAYQAPQVCVTSTDRTAYPLHWGRNYWPHPGGATVASGGMIQPGEVDSLCELVSGVYELLMADDFFPVVPTTQYTQGTTVIPMRGLLTVSEVQVDNLFDILRSRRPKRATYKKILPVGP